MPENSKENSRGPRFSVNLTVECYPSISPEEMHKELPAEEIPFGGEVKNISSGGACLLTARPLKESEVLKVSFPIQSSISAFISTPRTLVEVRWTKPANHDKFITGIRFLL